MIDYIQFEDLSPENRQFQDYSIGYNVNQVYDLVDSCWQKSLVGNISEDEQKLKQVEKINEEVKKQANELYKSLDNSEEA